MLGKNQESIINRECGYWGKLAVSVAIWANNNKVAHVLLQTVKRQFLWGHLTETGKERRNKHVLMWGGKFQVLGRPVLPEVRAAGSSKWPPEDSGTQWDPLFTAVKSILMQMGEERTWMGLGVWVWVGMEAVQCEHLTGVGQSLYHSYHCRSSHLVDVAGKDPWTGLRSKPLSAQHPVE